MARPVTISEVNNSFKVYYLKGGYKNMVCNSLLPFYTEEEANNEIKSLNATGYPAMKIQQSKIKLGGYFISSFECNSEEEMKKYYESAHATGFPYGNPLTDGPNAAYNRSKR